MLLTLRDILTAVKRHEYICGHCVSRAGMSDVYMINRDYVYAIASMTWFHRTWPNPDNLLVVDLRRTQDRITEQADKCQ